MRTSTQRLRDILDSQQCIRCNLFMFRLASGVEHYWTDGDVDVHALGRVYDSTGPSISGAFYKLVRGMQVSTLDLEVLVRPEHRVGGVSWPIAVRSGALDAAVVTIWKAFMPAWGEPAETLLIFSGEVKPITDVRQTVKLQVKSDASKLEQKVPGQVFKPGCGRQLYETGCGVRRGDNMQNGVILGIDSRYRLQTSLNKADGFFALGDVMFTSGANMGVRRAIKAYAKTGGQLDLSYPLVFDPQVGDSFVAYGGCDKTRGAGGCAKFGPGVEQRFSGTPYIPAPEVLV
nr:MAG TPA: minor tail protein [Caudoviricetes sp.]